MQVNYNNAAQVMRAMFERLEVVSANLSDFDKRDKEDLRRLGNVYMRKTIKQGQDFLEVGFFNGQELDDWFFLKMHGRELVFSRDSSSDMDLSLRRLNYCAKLVLPEFFQNQPKASVA